MILSISKPAKRMNSMPNGHDNRAPVGQVNHVTVCDCRVVWWLVPFTMCYLELLYKRMIVHISIVSQAYKSLQNIYTTKLIR